MAQTLVEAKGLGLAGPQVGIMRRVCIVIDQYINENDEDVDDIIELVNPEILETSGKLTIFEGCLSFPGRNGAITRPQYVKVRAQDRFGEWFELEAEDILARAICHECNHLDGVTILDLATKFYEDLSKEEIKKMNLDEEYDDE
ncbi:MAG: peptide deformylase, partial [Oscillospiraceae bacterium]